MSAFDRNVTYRYLLKAIQDLILLVADTRRILEVELERNVSTHEK